jgi:hypothetical protein
MRLCITSHDALLSAQAWRTLTDLYSPQSRARFVNTQIALATTKRNHLSITDYYSKMTHYANELAASGFPLRDDELVAYLLVGLDEEYNSVFTVVVARVNPISPSNWYAQLLNFKQHTHLQAPAASSISSSTMMASRSCGLPGHGVGGSDRDHGRSHFSRSHGRSSSGSRS